MLRHRCMQTRTHKGEVAYKHTCGPTNGCAQLHAPTILAVLKKKKKKGNGMVIELSPSAAIPDKADPQMFACAGSLFPQQSFENIL